MGPLSRHFWVPFRADFPFSGEVSINNIKVIVFLHKAVLPSVLYPLSSDASAIKDIIFQNNCSHALLQLSSSYEILM